jgi:hypothetical protein
MDSVIGFVVMRVTDRKYARPGGYESSWTDWLEEARIYATADAAMRDCCPENERVAPLFCFSDGVRPAFRF